MRFLLGRFLICILQDVAIEAQIVNARTTFTITVTEICKRWEFDMENDNMRGHWTGMFFEKDGKTFIDFIEDVTPKKFIMKPFIKGYLKKQQAMYVADLKQALSC